MTNDYLDSVKNQLQYYKTLGEKTFAQLPEEKLFWQYHEDSNSIATIVKHLWGNMLSRWTDFLATDGEKEWRKRDAEFENDLPSRQVLLDKWEAGWACCLNAINALAAGDLQKEIFIRNEVYTVTDAINRQLAHYAYHVGQIVFIGKIVAGSHWKSLTIPKGGSKEFNTKKFSQPRL